MEQKELPMSDTHRRHRAIKETIMQLFSPRPTGHQEKRINTLVALICGIVGSGHVQLPKIAEHAPGFGAKTESLIQRFRNWVQNDAVSWDVCFLPCAQALLAGLAGRAIVLAIDGSTVGRGCVTLMISVIYEGRALPLAWMVVAGKKGHVPETAHLALLEQVQAIMPAGATVIVVGDGEFDGVDFQAAIDQYGWQYVCRTAMNTLVQVEDAQIAVRDVLITQDSFYGVPNASVTAKQYGPVQIILVWDADQADPLPLVTNLELVEEALAWYRLRAHIETFFSDQKSRGFRLDKSHMSNPARIARLMIAACLAYIWIIYLGVFAKRDGWVAIIHRADRCDLSLFQLGGRLLTYFLKEGLPIPILFDMRILAEARE
jgi:hypothetical protein